MLKLRLVRAVLYLARRYFFSTSSRTTKNPTNICMHILSLSLSFSIPCLLETVKNNIVLVAYLLIDEELHHIRSLVATELDDLSALLVLLHGTIA